MHGADREPCICGHARATLIGRRHDIPVARWNGIRSRDKNLSTSRIAVRALGTLAVRFSASRSPGARIYQRNNIPDGIVYFVSKARLSWRKNVIS
ncbi:hypothetical protein [Paraburkholderia nodosa]|uniref:hypothetical protein n=1 Tax=Paraburkholderia nodosa TaxID=392320 RepID=UPI0012B6874D|nr:hypothetical protein [Paraburkholderia nodosa]